MNLFLTWFIVMMSSIQLNHIKVDGIERTYALYIPPSVDTLKNIPLVFILHGGGGTHRSILRLTKHRFNELADEYDFIAIYPDAVERHWNDGRGLARYRSQRENINDVRFIQSIIDTLSRIYSVDTTCVFATGMSNGGLMSIRLACDLKAVKKIAPVAALMPARLFSICKPQHPVGVMFFVGTHDPLVPFNGGDIHFRRLHLGRVISWDSTLSFFKNTNQCRGPIKKKTARDVWEYTFRDCAQSGRTIMYVLEGGGHTWPGGKSQLPEFIVGKTINTIMATDSIIKFFFKK